LTWLAADLAANTRDWLVAYWHHPPYSKGGHDSDTEAELVQMREGALEILERGGVDLVLTGHTHSYQRSVLLDGHYGPSSTLTETMKKDRGSGRPEETGAYRKSPGGGGRQGAVYVVAGSSGKVSPAPPQPHPAMFISLSQLGSMLLEVDGQRLEAKFIRETGAVDDHFTMMKEP
jgi:hypothetical protein